MFHFSLFSAGVQSGYSAEKSGNHRIVILALLSALYISCSFCHNLKYDRIMSLSCTSIDLKQLLVTVNHGLADFLAFVS
jgi:hypothetical protein